MANSLLAPTRPDGSQPNSTYPSDHRSLMINESFDFTLDKTFGLGDLLGVANEFKLEKFFGIDKSLYASGKVIDFKSRPLDLGLTIGTSPADKIRAGLDIKAGASFGSVAVKGGAKGSISYDQSTGTASLSLSYTSPQINTQTPYAYAKIQPVLELSVNPVVDYRVDPMDIQPVMSPRIPAIWSPRIPALTTPAIPSKCAPKWLGGFCTPAIPSKVITPEIPPKIITPEIPPKEIIPGKQFLWEGTVKPIPGVNINPSLPALVDVDTRKNASAGPSTPVTFKQSLFGADLNLILPSLSDLSLPAVSSAPSSIPGSWQGGLSGSRTLLDLNYDLTKLLPIPTNISGSFDLGGVASLGGEINLLKGLVGAKLDLSYSANAEMKPVIVLDLEGAGPKEVLSGSPLSVSGIKDLNSNGTIEGSVSLDYIFKGSLAASIDPKFSVSATALGASANYKIDIAGIIKDSGSYSIAPLMNLGYDLPVGKLDLLNVGKEIRLSSIIGTPIKKDFAIPAFNKASIPVTPKPPVSGPINPGTPKPPIPTGPITPGTPAQPGSTPGTTGTGTGTGKRYLAFSGGGWNSHSMLAGMVSGSLDAMESKGLGRSITTLFKGVEGIAANSGGGWFLTQLAYSTPFRQAFESLSETNNYKTTGFNGQTRQLFQPSLTTKSPSITGLPFVSGILQQAGGAVSDAVNWIDYYNNLVKTIGGTGLNWRNVVEQLVYKPYNMAGTLSSLNLTSPRESWATDKDLLFATALHSAPVTMETKGILRDKVFSRVSNPGVNPVAQFTPVTIASEVVTPGTAPQAKAILEGGAANLQYTNNAINIPFVSRAPKTVSKAVPAILNASGLNVMEPSVASSSAPAMVASPTTWAQRYLPGTVLASLRNELSELTKDIAPLAQLNNGQLTMPRTLPATSSLADSVSKLSAGNYTRVADGGYVDNISAANILKHIQKTEGTSQPFNLTLFSNTSTDPLTGIRMKTGANSLSSFTLPSDLAGLFGNSTGNNADLDNITFTDFGFNPKVPSNKIFDASAWLGEQPEWSTQNGDIDINYYKLNVRTVANKAFGIQPGQQGTLNIFVARNKNSSAAPLKPEYLDSYDNNFDTFRNAVSTGGAFPLIQDAFGLTAA